MEQDKQIVLIESQLKKADSAVTSVVVNNQESYDAAIVVGKKLSALKKKIEEDEKSITKPINDSLKIIRDKYRPYKDSVERLIDDVKSKMKAWYEEEAKKKAIAEERIAKRVEKGTMKETTAVNKLANMETAEAGGAMTSVLKVRVTDWRLVPEQFLELKETEVKKAIRAGEVVPGVDGYYEKSVRL